MKDKITKLIPEASIEQAQYPTVTVPKERLRDLALMLKNEEGFDYLISLIGMDWGETLGVIYYVARSAKQEDIWVLKTATTDRENPQLYTVSDLWKTADLNEREVFAMFGIRFINHPDMRRLYLAQDWKGFPLRKDYDNSGNKLSLDSQEMSDTVTCIEETANGIVEKKYELFAKDEYVVNIGPQHPATHGVLHFRVSLDGEIINKIDPNLGYIHRGVEKMCEGFTYPQTLHLTDRLDYLSAHINRHALCMTIENALGTEIPERVQYIRTIMDELTRVASHLLAWACMCMDMGALTAFIYGMRDREKIIDIFDKSCGGRLIMNYNLIGGLANDIHPDFQKDVKAFIPYMRKALKEYHALYTGNVIALERMKGVGMLSKEQAISFTVTGPSGRASGFSCDVRKYFPYAAYGKVKFEEIVRTDCDSFGRYMARLQEVETSLDIIEQLIDNIPEGDFYVKQKPIIRLPEGEFFGLAESPRGAFGVYICSKGEKNPYRVKFRSPGLSLVSVMDTVSRGEKIADFIAIGGSMDYVVPDIDR